jgi:hypothetical protein
LIVIGISIAVYINNVIDAKKKENMLSGIMKTTQDELKVDIEEIDFLIERYEEEKENYNFILDSLDSRSMKDCPKCPFVLTNFIAFHPKTRGYQQISNYIDSKVKTSDSLLFKISNFYKSSLKQFQIVENLAMDDMQDNLNYLKTEYPSFSELFRHKISPEKLTFFDDNTEFVNRVAMRKIIIHNNYLGLMKYYKAEAEKLIDEINM